MNIVIRRAVESDLPPMVEMLHELLSLEVDFEPDRGKQMRALRMILENPGCLLLAAEHEGNIVGTCSVQTLISTAEGGLSAMIEDIVVSREFRKCGIGRRFLEEAERWARGHGITRMQLLCDETNLPARKFYEKTGWDRTHLMNYFRFLQSLVASGQK